MSKIDLQEVAKSSRVMNMNETLGLLKSKPYVFMSWGPHAFTNCLNKLLRFKVNGHHHKGHVYVCVNGSDLYDIYLTTTKGTVVKKITDIFFTDLVDIIDSNVERIPEYK